MRVSGSSGAGLFFESDSHAPVAKVALSRFVPFALGFYRALVEGFLSRLAGGFLGHYDHNRDCVFRSHRGGIATDVVF
jgi:hypothetical protein